MTEQQPSERILFAGDTHGNIGHVRHLINVAVESNIRKVFVLGDFGYWEHQPEGVTFLDRVDQFATSEGVTVYFLDGNHDNLGLLVEKYDVLEDLDPELFVLVRPQVRYSPRGHRFIWGGARFISLGGAYSVDKRWRLDTEAKKKRPGTLWFPGEEMIDRDMDLILQEPTPVDVILAHDKPRSSNPMWNRKNLLECLPNQDRLERAVQALRPSYFLHGHLHYRYNDTVRTDGEVWCQVIGLDCEPHGSMAPWNYDPGDSWIIFDTEDL